MKMQFIKHYVHMRSLLQIEEHIKRKMIGTISNFYQWISLVEFVIIILILAWYFKL